MHIEIICNDYDQRFRELTESSRIKLEEFHRLSNEKMENFRREMDEKWENFRTGRLKPEDSQTSETGNAVTLKIQNNDENSKIQNAKTISNENSQNETITIHEVLIDVNNLNFTEIETDNVTIVEEIPKVIEMKSFDSINVVNHQNSEVKIKPNISNDVTISPENKVHSESSVEPQKPDESFQDENTEYNKDNLNSRSPPTNDFDNSISNIIESFEQTITTPGYAKPFDDQNKPITKQESLEQETLIKRIANEANELQKSQSGDTKIPVSVKI